jgi:hypothetical protein
MFARKMTSSSVKHNSLNKPPDIERETIDDYHKIMMDTAETLIKKRLLTPSSSLTIFKLWL